MGEPVPPPPPAPEVPSFHERQSELDRELVRRLLNWTTLPVLPRLLLPFPEASSSTPVRSRPLMVSMRLLYFYCSRDSDVAKAGCMHTQTYGQKKESREICPKVSWSFSGIPRDLEQSGFPRVERPLLWKQICDRSDCGGN